MEETAADRTGKEPAQAQDASAKVTTGGVTEAPQASRWSPGWTPKRIAAAAAVVLFVGWLVVKAADDPRRFAVVTLNGLTLAALFFVVASGFTLIFGLMRVVNMAHGSLYLLGGYLALQMQESWFKDDSGLGLSLSGSDETRYSLLAWIVPLLLATAIIGIVGVLVQQVFLRWNQGQDLRQALITIALSVIFADQMLAAYGGISKDIKTPSDWPTSITLPGEVRFGFFRGVVVLGAALLIAAALWYIIKRTGFGGVLGGTMISLAPGQDTAFLLNSLIVVIIGGMGSLGGAAIGALALGLVDAYADVYLVIGGTDLTNYSILVTFALLVGVLAVRPLGLFGRPA